MREWIDDESPRGEDGADRRRAHDRLSLQKALDGCAVGGEELPAEFAEAARQHLADDPDFAVQHRRRREFDAAVARAFADVPVPVDLAARLAAALAVEEPAVPAGTAPAGTALTQAAEAAPPSTPGRMARRRWLASAGSALAATVVGGAAWVWWRNRRGAELTVEQVLEEVLAFHQQAAADQHEARPVSRHRPPDALPLSRFVTVQAEPRVREFRRPLVGRTGVVYELAPADGPRAALYVMAEHGDRRAPGVPLLAAEPLPHPLMTGGCAMSAWREGDRIVLLVVDGDERRYREFLSAPRQFA